MPGHSEFIASSGECAIARLGHVGESSIAVPRVVTTGAGNMYTGGLHPQSVVAGVSHHSRCDTAAGRQATCRSADAKVALGKDPPKAIVRRQAIDHAATIAVKAMMICRVSWVLMAGAPAGRMACE